MHNHIYTHTQERQKKYDFVPMETIEKKNNFFFLTALQ